MTRTARGRAPWSRKGAGICAATALLAAAACGTTVSPSALPAGPGGATGSGSADGLTPPVAAGSGGSTTDIGGLPNTSQDGSVPGAVGPGAQVTSPSQSGNVAPGSTVPQGSGGSVTKPIKVGLFAADYTKLVKSVGGSTSGSDPHAINRAIVKALNARGGLAGRKIEPVYETLDGTAADYSAQEQAACETFTRDNRVEVVISNGVGSEIFYSCLLRAGLGLVTGNPTEGTDTVTLRQYPNVFDPPGMTTDRQAVAYIEQSIRTKWLTKSNKVGVLLSGCPWGTRTYDKIVVPRLRALGASVEQFSIGCPAKGSGELGTTSSATQNAVLQFRSANVDRVMILTGHGDATAYVSFTSNAESQGWRPGYIVGSNAVAQAWVAQGVVSKEQAANTRGAGWVPVVDITNAPLSAEGRACFDLTQAGGAPPPNPKGQFGLTCDAWMSLRAALIRSGGVTNLVTLRSAFEGMGTSFVGAGGIDGGIRLGPNQHDGAYLVAPTAYVKDCSCFRYLAAPQAVS